MENFFKTMLTTLCIKTFFVNKNLKIKSYPFKQIIINILLTAQTLKISLFNNKILSLSTYQQA